MSSPSAWAPSARSVSVRLIRTGKLVRLASTWVWLMVIFLRWFQESLYQSAELVVNDAVGGAFAVTFVIPHPSRVSFPSPYFSPSVAPEKHGLSVMVVVLRSTLSRNLSVSVDIPDTAYGPVDPLSVMGSLVSSAVPSSFVSDSTVTLTVPSETFATVSVRFRSLALRVSADSQSVVSVPLNAALEFAGFEPLASRLISDWLKARS